MGIVLLFGSDNFGIGFILVFQEGRGWSLPIFQEPALRAELSVEARGSPTFIFIFEFQRLFSHSYIKLEFIGLDVHSFF
jgi:hypothetical protein